MIYTLIHYREDGSDYCRGCLMGRTSSDQEIASFLTIEEAARSIAEKRFINKNADREYSDYVTTILINGWDRDDYRRPGYDNWIESAAGLVAPDTPWCEVEKAATAEFNRMVEAEKEQKRLTEEAKAAAAEARRIKDADDQEKRDRAEFERLSAKFRAA